MEEVKKLYELLNDVQVHNRLMVKLAIDVGLRRSEILALEWKDINFKTQKIKVMKSKVKKQKKRELLLHLNI